MTCQLVNIGMLLLTQARILFMTTFASYLEPTPLILIVFGVSLQVASCSWPTNLKLIIKRLDFLFKANQGAPDSLKRRNNTVGIGTILTTYLSTYFTSVTLGSYCITSELL